MYLKILTTLKCYNILRRPGPLIGKVFRGPCPGPHVSKRPRAQENNKLHAHDKNVFTIIVVNDKFNNI